MIRGSSSRGLLVVAVVAAVLAVLLGAPGAAAQPDDITEFPLPTALAGPTAIVAGPDGNVWFTEQAANKIGRITPSGVITEFPLSGADSAPQAIATGPDGNLWFTEPWGNNIGRITTSGTITEFPVLATPTHYPGPWGITAGPDGNLWFTGHEAFGIGRITPAGAVREYHGGTEPAGITAGPDGNLWFTDAGSIGRITPSGIVTQYPPPGTSHDALGSSSSPFEISAGPDGNVWFAEQNWIGRITKAGAITTFQLPSASHPPVGIAAGPDGNLWFTRGNAIGRITPDARNGTPLVVKRFCPINVTEHNPAPTKVGRRVFTDRITTKRSACVLRRPVVRCRLSYPLPDSGNPSCKVKVTKRGKILVTTKESRDLTVTVIVEARPKVGFANKWAGRTWRQIWDLRPR